MSRTGQSSVKKNFLYQCIYEVLLILLPFITSPYLARVLGAEKLGIYSYNYTIVNYFVLAARLGISNYGNRSIAAVRDNQEELNKTFSNIYALTVLMASVVGVCYIGYAVLFAEYRTIAFIQFLYIIACFFDINWFFFGIEKFKLTVTRNSILKVATVVVTLLLVKDENDLWLYCVILAMSSLIGQLAVFGFLRREIHFVRPTFAEMSKHFRPMAVLFIPVLAVSLYKNMDKIMLGNFSTKTQVGFYENSEKVLNISQSVIAAFGTVMMPRMSNLAAGGNIVKIKENIEKSEELVMCMAFALAFGMASVAENFSVVFWGSEFEPCGKIIVALALTLPFLSFANVLRTQYLIPQKRDKSYIISVFAGAGVNIAANFYLIPVYQAFGAAIGTVLAESTVCIIQAFLLHRELPILLYIRKSIFFLLIGFLMYVLVSLIGSIGTGILILAVQVVSGAVLYCALCLIYFKITDNKIVMPMVYGILRKLHLKRG